ncbi:hypothetical protein M9H77_09104 [Catharanthus roseus]|uniref:Uncharacterized protein n=1 Tax=Catharanthus roseus TaxID=4058 RepID=A0ACC0BZM7_CATRO|nr:hypothetical protein M9H77_09104 [Catharanthus roseus]
MPQMIMPQPLAKTEKAIFMASEDIVLIKQIMATYTLASYKLLSNQFSRLLKIFSPILPQQPQIISLLSKTEAPKEKPNTKTFATMPETLSNIINRRFSEAKNRGETFRENFVVLFS